MFGVFVVGYTASIKLEKRFFELIGFSPLTSAGREVKPLDGSYHIGENDKITLKATAKEGFRFGKYRMGNGAEETKNPLVVQPNFSKVHVYFEKI